MPKPQNQAEIKPVGGIIGALKQQEKPKVDASALYKQEAIKRIQNELK